MAKMVPGGNCRHPMSKRDESISHLGDPEWAYCFGCACVLHREKGKWVAQNTGIAKATYLYGGK